MISDAGIDDLIREMNMKTTRMKNAVALGDFQDGVKEGALHTLREMIEILESFKGKSI